MTPTPSKTSANSETRRGRRGKKGTWTNTQNAVTKLENLMKCINCSNQLKDPCVVGSCEHVFCKLCAQTLLGKHCPECNIPVQTKDVQPDLLIKNIVNLTSQLRDTVDDEHSPATSKGSSDGGSDSNDEPVLTRTPNGRQSKRTANEMSSAESPRTRRRLRPSADSNSATKTDNKIPAVANPGIRLKRNIKGETPLHLAAIKGDVVNIRRLLHQGANPNEKDNAGWTPLHEACHHGHTKIAEILIDQGAIIDVPAVDNETPLHDAVSMEKVEIVALLVSRGANVNVRNSRGLIPGDMSKSEEMKIALATAKVPVSPAKSTGGVQQNESEDIILLTTCLSNEQQLELEKCAKILNALIVENFSDRVTHVIADCDDNGHCQRTMKFMQAVLAGKWVLNFTWVEECLAFHRKVFEEPYEVTGNKKQQSVFGARRARLNIAQQFPPLFDGCSFYLHGNFAAPSPNRETLAQLVKLGGGAVLNREPRQQDKNTQPGLGIPYHATKDAKDNVYPANQFVIYQDFLPQRLKKIPTQQVRCETFTWLLNCISAFQLLPPFK